MDRQRRQVDPERVRAALQASRGYACELRALLEALGAEEAALAARAQRLRQKLALRRAERAALALLGPSAPAAGGAVFEREAESAYRKVGVAPRSFIRPKRSFFYDEAAAGSAKRARTQSAATGGAGTQGEELARLAEPQPNADTMFLRSKTHEAFIATPSRVFSAKEREGVRRFAEAQATQHGLQAVELAGGRPQPVLLPLTTWADISRLRPPIHRSAFSCKLWWELHEDPSLRLCAWTKQEDEALRKLASGDVDPELVNKWEEIANRMPIPGRPPVHCLIRYQTKLCKSNVNTTFTPEEDAIIQQAVDVFGEKWNIIADLMDGRVAEQIRHRWQLSLAPGIRQGKFSIVEDRRLLLAIAAYQVTTEAFQKETVPWQDVAHHVTGRTLPALRDRFLNSLNPELTFSAWTAKEDAVIKKRFKELGGLESPGIWAQIASELGNRSDNQVARRWKSLVPSEYERLKRVKQDNMTATAVFRRPTMRRRDPTAQKRNQTRSTYNPLESDASDQTGIGAFTSEEGQAFNANVDLHRSDDDSSGSDNTLLIETPSHDSGEETDGEAWAELDAAII